MLHDRTAEATQQVVAPLHTAASSHRSNESHERRRRRSVRGNLVLAHSGCPRPGWRYFPTGEIGTVTAQPSLDRRSRPGVKTVNVCGSSTEAELRSHAIGEVSRDLEPPKCGCGSSCSEGRREEEARPRAWDRLRTRRPARGAPLAVCWNPHRAAGPDAAEEGRMGRIRACARERLVPSQGRRGSLLSPA